jgi:hypothetical protein
MKNNYYVYLHIKETDGEPFYVGKGLKGRYKSKQARSKYWNNIVNKCGFDVIFLEIDLNEQEAFEKEIYWIKRIGRKDLGLGTLVNFTDGGEGGSGKILSNETKRKMSEAKKGKIISDEHKRKISESQKNITDETKRKMSEAKKGNKYNLGRKTSEETKEKLRKINNDKKHAEEVKNKISESQIGHKRNLGKKHKIIICPICNKEGGINNMSRFHFDNCKNIHKLNKL